MALYVDSAYLDDITEVVRMVPLAGVTTNPTIILSAQQKGQKLTPVALLEQLLQKTNGILFMQPSMASEESAFQEALIYIRFEPERIIPKIPCTQAGMRVALRLKSLGHRISFTAVTTVSQAYSCAMAQADFIIPYYNRMTRSGINASERVAQMAELLHNQRLPTRILVASLKTAAEASDALLAGAHDLTVPTQILLEMVSDPETEQAVEKFEQDYRKLKL